MGKQKFRYYVVWAGRQPGVYDSWESCRKNVSGFPDAKYKGFESLQEANQAFGGNSQDYQKKVSKSEQKPLIPAPGKPATGAICVDAACSGNPGILEYRGVLYPSGEEIFHRGPFPEGTTNIGEFLAIVTGLAWLQQRGLTIPLYSDSRNGILWVKQKRINTSLIRTASNEGLFMVIDKALEWLHNNSYENKILKWETSSWGEIPADFGRK